MINLEAYINLATADLATLPQQVGQSPAVRRADAMWRLRGAVHRLPDPIETTEAHIVRERLNEALFRLTQLAATYGISIEDLIERRLAEKEK